MWTCKDKRSETLAILSSLRLRRPKFGNHFFVESKLSKSFEMFKDTQKNEKEPHDQPSFAMLLAADSEANLPSIGRWPQLAVSRGSDPTVLSSGVRLGWKQNGLERGQQVEKNGDK